MLHSKSIDEVEIAKFSAMADEWWDTEGKFKPLHKFNPIRIAYIRDTIVAHFKKSVQSEGVLSGISLLDIGCGGGLLSEPMARLGASVTSIDASEKNIQIASLHAKNIGLDIDYRCTSAEELADHKKQFDVVLNMEVIEHVADVNSFVKACSELVKPGGIMIVATMNRTVKSYAFAIIGAEYILKWLPCGTHDWEKFLKPSEIEKPLRENGLALKYIQGVSYNPLSDNWKLTKDISVNYILVAVKK
ncbi:MAG: ubiG [Rickettsiaceae bacterium]|jgi:2-polyprenyl-6-hydroxyphenyl methylase/3-demethylubiquinone-9 3-methyltransferase|nr:ubiG [Rickettsiaceae bacterium]